MTYTQRHGAWTIRSDGRGAVTITSTDGQHVTMTSGDAIIVAQLLDQVAVLERTNPPAEHGIHPYLTDTDRANTTNSEEPHLY